MTNYFYAKPFVKWAGGKRQLIDQITEHLPLDFENQKNITYIEPFVGGGAMLFHLLKTYPNIKKAIINDINYKLICTYRIIKNNVYELIDSLNKIQNEFYNLTTHEEQKSYFLHKRKKFNSTNISEIEIASLFIFLNRTCFNGLYRENKKGEFNVPFGRYKNPKICDEKTLLADSELLKNVEILLGDYSEIEKYVNQYTLIYFDPPYKPLNNTSSFNSYVKEAFDNEEQNRLSIFVRNISKKAFFLLSNSDFSAVNPGELYFEKLYEGFSINKVFATRAVNAKASNRGKLSELLIQNY